MRQGHRQGDNPSSTLVSTRVGYTRLTPQGLSPEDKAKRHEAQLRLGARSRFWSKWAKKKRAAAST